MFAPDRRPRIDRHMLVGKAHDLDRTIRKLIDIPTVYGTPLLAALDPHGMSGASCGLTDHPGELQDAQHGSVVLANLVERPGVALKTIGLYPQPDTDTRRSVEGFDIART